MRHLSSLTARIVAAVAGAAALALALSANAPVAHAATPVVHSACMFGGCG